MFKFLKNVWHKLTRTPEREQIIDCDLEPFDTKQLIQQRVIEIWGARASGVMVDVWHEWSDTTRVELRYRNERRGMSIDYFSSQRQFNALSQMRKTKFIDNIDMFIKSFKKYCDAVDNVINKYPFLETAQIGFIDPDVISDDCFYYNPTIMVLIRYLKCLSNETHYTEYRAYIINQLSSLASNPCLRNLACHVGNLDSYEAYVTKMEDQFKLGVDYSEVSSLFNEVMQSAFTPAQLALANIIAQSKQAENVISQPIYPIIGETTHG